MVDLSPRTQRPLRVVLPGGSGEVGQMLARHFQQLESLLPFAKLHLREHFLLFRRQFSNEVFGEHEL